MSRALGVNHDTVVQRFCMSPCFCSVPCGLRAGDEDLGEQGETGFLTEQVERWLPLAMSHIVPKCSGLEQHALNISRRNQRWLLRSLSWVFPRAKPDLTLGCLLRARRSCLAQCPLGSDGSPEGVYF